MRIRPDWDRAQLKKVHGHDNKQLYHLMYFPIGETEDCRVSHSFVGEFLKWFESRSSQLQHRLRKVVVEQSGQVSFAKYGEYTLVRAEACADTNMERVTHLQHVATKHMVELDASTCFTSSGWALDDNWSKYSAFLQSRTTAMRLPVFHLFNQAFPEHFPAQQKRSPQEKAAETRAAKKRRKEVLANAMKEWEDDDEEEEDGEAEDGEDLEEQRRAVAKASAGKRAPRTVAGAGQRRIVHAPPSRRVT